MKKKKKKREKKRKEQTNKQTKTKTTKKSLPKGNTLFSYLQDNLPGPLPIEELSLKFRPGQLDWTFIKP